MKNPPEWIKTRDNQLIKNQELSYLFDKDILGIAAVGYLGIQEIKSKISNYEALINL